MTPSSYFALGKAQKPLLTSAELQRQASNNTHSDIRLMFSLINLKKTQQHKKLLQICITIVRMRASAPSWQIELARCNTCHNNTTGHSRSILHNEVILFAFPCSHKSPDCRKQKPIGCIDQDSNLNKNYKVFTLELKGNGLI